MTLPASIVVLKNRIVQNQEQVLKHSAEIKDLFTSKSVMLNESNNVYTPAIYDIENQVNRLFDLKSKLESSVRNDTAEVLKQILAY